MNKDDALCAQTDPDMFFPLSANQVPKQAYAVCARCPVVEECLDEALSIPRVMDYGVWGGTSPADRVRIRKSSALRTVYLDRLREQYGVSETEEEPAKKQTNKRTRNYYPKERNYVDSTV
jgi:WhiB family redox-sensing transcriptional regulator